MNAAASDPPPAVADATPSPLSTPVSASESGLSRSLLEDTVARQLLESGVDDLAGLSMSTALSSRLLESILQTMRADARVEIRGAIDGGAALRYTLTDGGRRYAREARERSGYIGPAPISVEHYRTLIASQSVHAMTVARAAMEEAFADVIIKPELRDRLGAALHSGKGIFVYGPAGTGKTFICSRLIRLLRTPVFIPHAVVVGDSIVRVFDPALHRPLDNPGCDSPWIPDRSDPRLVLCERPFIVSGGELTADMLEIRRDAATRQYLAPLQLKATHGIYMIDDLGRQKMTTDELFNRWIVPMESGVDYLNMDSGARLVMPFDVILIFSTNFLPEDLADPAFQRRIGHKIGFEHLDAQSYTAIWRQECERRGVEFREQSVEYAIHELHARTATPMLACHPRDLIGMALDYSRYAGEPDRVDPRALSVAWQNYFAHTLEPSADS